jgi:predicted 2-oxoglutarate/Fe(II)-dependent dioxygenase YbiX
MKKELAPGIMQFNFSEDIAKRLISLTDTLTWIKASVYGENKSIRKSKGLNLYKYLPELNKEVLNEIDLDLKEYSNYYGIDVFKNNGISFLKYSVGDFYKLHLDSVPEMVRTFSVIIYLNPSEYSGGETYFKHFDLSIKPEKPSMLIFPSNYPYLHESKPILDGNKYVLVDWYI